MENSADKTTEPANYSRDFWMPDHSCRVCYECDAQFTVFNRRHHCRLCGRVFCGKCTANSIPAAQNNNVRVCRYCFEQWEQEVASPSGMGPPAASTTGPTGEDTGDTSPDLSEHYINRSEDDSDECDTASVEGMEPVDFENNRLLWIPPEPENPEDEWEGVEFVDDDDEDAVREWKTLRPSSSFGSGEYRSRDRSSEEYKKAMKNEVDKHFRALVSQLLQVENLITGEEDDKERWLEIITSLSWEASTVLKPYTSEGGGMDPRGYVKIKCLACGHRRESVVVKGVVCKKNVSHKGMPSKIENPRFLILGGALEEQRLSNHLSSFNLRDNETDHLEMAVAKIGAHHPNVLLVEKSISRSSQEYLIGKEISLVLNIKRPLLERIARCTGAQIVPSIDHLSSQKPGYCEAFHVEKFLESHGSAGQGGKKLVKTLMFFEGCPKPLGCTILLKGANGDELKKVKHVLHYGVFAAYHLALETSFLADEGASLPELPLKSPITVALPDKPSSIDRSISTIPGFAVVPTPSKPHGSQLNIDSQKDRNHLDEPGSLKEDFPPSPSDHQSILVSSSTRSVLKGTVCERAHLLRIKYYGSFDKPLGRFLRDDLFAQSYRCSSCEEPSEAHVHSYTHWQGSLTIFVKRIQSLCLPGERDGKIWMWHRCLLCPRPYGLPPSTRRVVMSDPAWGLSFGKFLDLSFSNHAEANCGHSLHRDCLRFYGFGNMFACFRYASPTKLDFSYENPEVVDREELVCTGVLNALRQIAIKVLGTLSVKVAESKEKEEKKDGT